jgi:hypothetical protein
VSLIEFGQGVGFSANPIEYADKLLFVQVAQLQPEHNPSWDYIVCAWFDLDPSNCADLPSRHAGDHLVDLVDEAGGRKQRIVARVHWRGAGVVGKALDRDFRMENTYDPFDYADIDFLLLQSPALFDVQLKVSGDGAWLPPRRGRLIKVASDQSRALANCLATLRYHIKLVLIQPSAQCLTADRATLLILEDDDLKGMTS